VLIVDDEPDTVVSLMAILRDEGYEAEGVYNGDSAIRYLDEFRPDVVLVDMAMPGMSGWDVAREVRNRHQGMPMLIGISGTYVKAPDELLARVAGFNHFFVKPLDPKRLTGILRTLALNK
jgi:two-component system, OmpR family, response regulator